MRGGVRSYLHSVVFFLVFYTWFDLGPDFGLISEGV